MLLPNAIRPSLAIVGDPGVEAGVGNGAWLDMAAADEPGVAAGVPVPDGRGVAKDGPVSDGRGV